MDVGLVDLAKEAFQLIVESQKITRADLNAHFGTGSNARKNEALSTVIRSFLRYGRVAKFMNQTTNTVTFWVPDNFNADMKADVIDVSTLSIEDYLGQALARDRGEAQEHKVEPGYSSAETVIQTLTTTVVEDTVKEAIEEEEKAAVVTDDYHFGIHDTKTRRRILKVLTDKAGSWVDLDVLVEATGKLGRIVSRFLNIMAREGLCIKAYTKNNSARYALPKTFVPPHLELAVFNESGREEGPKRWAPKRIHTPIPAPIAPIPAPIGVAGTTTRSHPRMGVSNEPQTQTDTDQTPPPLISTPPGPLGRAFLKEGKTLLFINNENVVTFLPATDDEIKLSKEESAIVFEMFSQALLSVILKTLQGSPS
jgi:hypothetical protein